MPKQQKGLTPQERREAKALDGLAKQALQEYKRGDLKPLGKLAE